MFRLGAGDAVTCGSVMVPPSWFPEVAARQQSANLDLGVHLTLTSESAAFRWRPLSTADRRSGLMDLQGYMWPTVPQLRQHAVAEAVEEEMRAQIEAALAAGIDVTHLDHHMGAALAPEFVTATVGVARDHRLPLLFPRNVGGFLDQLQMGEVDVTVLEAAHREAADAGLAVGDTFLMGLTYQHERNPRATFERLLAGLGPGVTYLSLHCAAPGDIEQVHPRDAHWRIGEHRLFSDPDFVAWLSSQPFRIAGMREYRDTLSN